MNGTATVTPGTRMPGQKQIPDFNDLVSGQTGKGEGLANLQ